MIVMSLALFIMLLRNTHIGGIFHPPNNPWISKNLQKSTNSIIFLDIHSFVIVLLLPLVFTLWFCFLYWMKPIILVENRKFGWKFRVNLATKGFGLSLRMWLLVLLRFEKIECKDLSRKINTRYLPGPRPGPEKSKSAVP